MLSNYNRLSAETFECNEQTWINQESKNFYWYKQTYPNLNEFNLPLSMEFLKYFYFSDMQDRNLIPNSDYFTCYALLWSYFLGRISGQITFKARSWWELVEENFPNALKKTATDILNPFTNPIMMTVLLAGLGYLIINKILE